MEQYQEKKVVPLSTRYLLSLLMAFLVVSLSAQTAEQWLKSGIDLYKTQAYEQALHYFEEGLKIDPDNYQLLKHKADCHHKLKAFAEAILHYDIAVNYSSEDPEIYLNRGMAKMSLGRYNAALKDFDKSVSLKPASDLALYFRGAANFNLGNVKKAGDDFDQVVKLNPNFALAYHARGTVSAELNKFQDGVDDYKRAFAMDSTLSDVFFDMAVLQYEAKAYHAALENFNQIIDERNEYLAEAFYYRAEVKNALRKKEEACTDWKAAADLGDKDALEVYANFCLKGKKKSSFERKRKSMISF